MVRILVRRLRELRFLPLALALCAASGWAKPNIVFIMTDDVGYGDIGAYGATVVKTPNVDRLASQGMRFTNGHASASVCSPSRFAFLTGVYAWRPPALAAGIIAPTGRMSIAAGQPTVATVLKGAGYATGLVGKWHLGLGNGDLDFNKAISPGPREHGFDYAFFIPTTNDRIPCVYVENRNVYRYDPADPITVGAPGTPTGTSHPGMLLYRTTDNAHAGTICNGISRIGLFNGGKAARWSDEYMIDTLTAKAVRFIEDNRAKPFFLFFATHDVHEPRYPNPRFRDKSACGIRCDALMEMDWSVGEIMATLDRLKLAESTLVVFTSDNGPSVMEGYDDGSRANLNGHAPSGPLRGAKNTLYEGGARVPFIARWPGTIPAASVSGQLVAQQDMLATFAAINNIGPPGGVCLDSRNILPTLKNGAVASRTQYIVQGNGTGNLAILSGDFKLIRGSGELYNLRTDLAESSNIASANAALAARLRDSLAAAATCVPTPVAAGAPEIVRKDARFCSLLPGTRVLRLEPGQVPIGARFSVHNLADGKLVFAGASLAAGVRLPAEGLYVVTARWGGTSLVNTLVTGG